MTCTKCGGEFAKWAKNCPYCGEENSDYKERDWQYHLDAVEYVAKVKHLSQSYDKLERRKRLRNRIACALLVLLCCLKLAQTQAERIKMYSYGKLNQSAGQDFSNLDEWYRAGKFEHILNWNYNSKGHRNVDAWPHYYFVVEYYQHCRNVTELRRLIADGADLKEYPEELKAGFTGAVFLRAMGEDSALERLVQDEELTEEEADRIRECRKEGEALLKNDLGRTEEEIAELQTTCVDGDYFRYSPCIRRAEELLAAGEDDFPVLSETEDENESR